MTQCTQESFEFAVHFSRRVAYLMEVRSSDDARAVAARRGLKEAWNKRASRWTKTGYKAPAPDERATYREVHIHQGREA
jgi:hypothetical protein